MDFLEQLYSNMESGYINIWTLQDKGSAWFRHDELDRAMEYALRQSESKDVYFGVNPRCAPIPGKRGGAEDVCAVVALYADIDIRNDAAHKKQSLPKDQAEALRFVGQLPFAPTFTIDSGNGLHLYWQLTEPIIIEDDASLSAIVELSRGWGQYVCDRANQLYGWELDNVSDLARALRVPGTQNHKSSTPVVVRVIACNGSTYNPADFEGYTQKDTPDSEYLQRQPKGFMLPDRINDGSRNETLFKLASSLRAKGLSEVAIDAALQAENRARCIPPKGEDEVRTIAHSAAKYVPGTLTEQTQAAAVVALEQVDDTAESLMSDATLNAIAAIRDDVERQRRIVALREKAKRLHIAEPFNIALKARLMQAQSSRVADEARADEDDFICLPGMPITGLRSPSWRVDNSGVYRIQTIKGLSVTEWACPHPIIITERLVNADSKLVKVRLAFYDNGQWQDVIVDRSAIASRQSIVRLADTGIMVNSENAKYLVRYLGELEAANREVIPNRRSVSRLGWLGQLEFSPYADALAFDGEAYYRDLYGAVQVSGSEERWLEAISAARKNISTRAILAASFTAPLVGLLNKPVFIVHLWGDTGTGKSVVMQLAASVWGNPRVLTRTFNATSVGMERLAAFFHSLPLCLDEFQTLRKDRIDVDTLLYTLTEGKSKAMGRRDGGVAIESRWANVILTNGEEPLTTDRSGGGAKNRAVEIYINKPLLDDAAATAGLIQENYGHAGPRYIAALIQEISEHGTGEFHRLFHTVHDKHRGNGTDKQINAVAFLALGEYSFCRFILRMNSENARQMAFELADALTTNAMKPEEVDLVERAWHWVTGWLASNREHFKGGEGFAFYTPLYGRYENNVAYVIGSVLNTELEKAGFSIRKCINGFKERGWLIPCPDGSIMRSQWNLSMDGITTRCYKLKVPSNVSGREMGEEVQEVMPF